MKKKRTTIALILVLVITVLTLASCVDTLTRQSRAKYVIEKYGMDEILCCISVYYLFGFTVDGEYLGEDTYTRDKEFNRAYDYFLGTKDGEEVAFIISCANGRRTAESEWIFDVSFREIFQMLNEKSGKTVSPPGTEYSLRAINTYDNMDEMVELVPEIEQITLDVPLMLLYNYSNEEAYAIVQSEGEILLFNYGTPADNN